MPATVGGRAAPRPTTPAPASAPPSSPSGYDPSYAAPVRLGGSGSSPVVPRSDGGGTSWHAPSVAAPRSSRSPYLVLLVVAVVAVAGVAGWRFVQGRLNAPPAGTQAFVDGGGVTYTPQGQGYAVRLPASPMEQSSTQNVAGTPVTAHAAYASGDDWEIAVASADVGPIAAATIDAALAGAAGGFASTTGGEVKDRERVTHQGHAAVDVTVDVDDDYPARVRVVYDGRRAYVLVVHSKRASGTLFDELVNSFQLVA